MSTFTSNIVTIYGAQGQEWLDHLSTITEKIAQEKNITDLKAVENLSHNYVLEGYQNKKSIVLKIGLDSHALQKESAALKLFSRSSAVECIDEGSVTFGRCSQRSLFIIVEKAIPGCSLQDALLADNMKLKIACTLMHELHKANLPKKHFFPHITDWLFILDKDWNIPAQYLQKARSLRTSLLKKIKSNVLLHGDLHYDNILQHHEGWITIDPKGVIGTPLFETFSFITDIEKDTTFIANASGYDVQELRDWYFVRLILAICWNLEDRLNNNLLLPLLEKAYNLTSL